MRSLRGNNKFVKANNRFIQCIRIYFYFVKFMAYFKTFVDQLGKILSRGKMNTIQRTNIAAVIIAIVAFVVAVLSFLETTPLKADMADLKTSTDNTALAIELTESEEIEPAQLIDIPNVARDPADVPPPITRTEPTIVEITLTFKELTAELADGTTYTFWTFDGTIPGPMLRVMEGDTVKVTTVDPFVKTHTKQINVRFLS